MKFNLNEVFQPKLFGLFKKGQYDKSKFVSDLIAGLIVGIIALPLAIAFATASGVPPQNGLITAIIAGFLISFFGGSDFLIGGPTGAFIVIITGIIAGYGFQGLLIATIIKPGSVSYRSRFLKFKVPLAMCRHRSRCSQRWILG